MVASRNELESAGSFSAKRESIPVSGRSSRGWVWPCGVESSRHKRGWFCILEGSLGALGAKAAGVIGADETPRRGTSFARERSPGWHLNSSIGHPMEREDSEKPRGAPCRLDPKEGSPDD